MKIEFRTDDAPHYDLVLSTVRSRAAFASRWKELVDSAEPGASLHVAFRPPFLDPAMTLPIAFRLMHERADAAKEKNLTVHVHVAGPQVIQVLSRELPEARRQEVHFQVGTGTLRVRRCNIVAAGTSAIVNASNTRLKLGGGVSHAIRLAARPTLQPELDRIASRRTLVEGDVVLTGSHGIPGVAHILHVASAMGEPEAIRRGIRNALDLADAHEIRSVAFPALGTGTGMLNPGTFVTLFLDELERFFTRNTAVRTVDLVLWQKSDEAEVEQLVASRFAAAS